MGIPPPKPHFLTYTFFTKIPPSLLATWIRETVTQLSWASNSVVLHPSELLLLSGIFLGHLPVRPRSTLQRTDISHPSRMDFHPQDLSQTATTRSTYTDSPKILHPSWRIQSKHHDYKSQETQQQFSLMHQIANNSRSTFIKLENVLRDKPSLPPAKTLGPNSSSTKPRSVAMLSVSMSQFPLIYIQVAVNQGVRAHLLPHDSKYLY